MKNLMCSENSEDLLISVTDNAGKITYANKKFSTTSKYSENELLGNTHNILKSGYHSKSFYKNMWATVSSGKIWSDKIKNKTKDGKTYWVKSTMIPILGDNSSPIQYVCISHIVDTSKGKKPDLVTQDLLQYKDDEIKFLKNRLSMEKTNSRNLQTQYFEELEMVKKDRHNIIQECDLLKSEYEFSMVELIENEKLNILGEFSAMLAHDLRNPLNVICTVIEIVKIRSKNDEFLSLYLEKLNRAANRMTRLVDDTLGFVRKSPMKITTVNVKTLIGNVIENCHLLKNIEILISDSTVEIECDEQKIDAVFTNIFYNAAQSMNQKGIIKIKIIEQNDFCEISFEDSGPGIPKDKIDKIFQPLFTTKQEGTGLGLAICTNIMNQHNGEISVKNNPTTFSLKLPKKFKKNI